MQTIGLANHTIGLEMPNKKGCKFGCVCSYTIGHCPGVGVQIRVCLICVISTYSNGTVQIRVCLELAEIRSTTNTGLRGAKFEGILNLGFPNCPEISRFVPLRLLFSPIVPVPCP